MSKSQENDRRISTQPPRWRFRFIEIPGIGQAIEESLIDERGRCVATVIRHAYDDILAVEGDPHPFDQISKILA